VLLVLLVLPRLHLAKKHRSVALVELTSAV
jgi:hypothetical protein